MVWDNLFSIEMLLHFKIAIFSALVATCISFFQAKYELILYNKFIGTFKNDEILSKIHFKVILRTVFFLIIIYIFSLFFIAYISPIVKHDDEKMLAIKKLLEVNVDITTTRANYEGLNEDYLEDEEMIYSQTYLLNTIKSSSEEQIYILSNIKDDLLSVAYKLFKYDNLSYILAISAEIADSLDKEKKIIDGLEACDKAFVLVNQIILNAEHKITGTEVKLKEWVDNGQIVARLHTVRCWLLAIKSLIDERVIDQERFVVQEEFNKIPRVFVENHMYLFRSNASLKEFELRL